MICVACLSDYRYSAGMAFPGLHVGRSASLSEPRGGPSGSRLCAGLEVLGPPDR